MTSENLHKDKVFTRAFDYSFLNSYSLRNTNFFCPNFLNVEVKALVFMTYYLPISNSNA